MNVPVPTAAEAKILKREKHVLVRLRRYWGNEITDRQKRLIVKYWKEGLPQRAIAEASGLGVRTVERYFSRWRLERTNRQGRKRQRTYVASPLHLTMPLLVPGLGARIRAIRDAKSLPRTRLCEAGLRWNIVQRAELRDRATPMTLVRLAVYLECTLTELVGEQ